MTQTFAKPHWNSARATAFTNVRLVDPETGLDEQGGLLVKDGKIADFGPRLFGEGTPEGAERIDGAGHVLCPGLHDIQVHFREPGQEYKEVIETGTRSAVAGGVTTAVCMANTKPVVDDMSVVDFIAKKTRESGYCRVHTYGAITKGLEGREITEMALMAEAGAIGFSDDGKPVMNSLIMRRAMEYASHLGVVISQHAEDVHLSNGGCINEGRVSARLGVTGIPNASEAIIVARDLLLLELTGGHYHVLHVSTHQALDAVRRAKKQGLNVTCEVAPHHFVLTDEAVEEYRTFAKMNPPLRAEADRLAMIEGLKDGTIDVIATDHAPHDQDSKRVPLSSASFGIVGLETMLPLSLKLYQEKQLSLREVLAAMTYKAADVIRRPGGRLKKGAAADLTLIDLDREWVIDPEHFHSKSKNSPFDGFRTKGRAVLTMVGGEVVYRLA